MNGCIAEHGQHGGLSESGDFDELDGFREEDEGDDADERQDGGDPLDEFSALFAFVIGGAESDDSAEVSDHAGVTCVGDEECGVEDGEGTDQEQPAGVFSEDWNVAAGEGTDHSHAFGVATFRVQHADSHEVERGGGECVDDHGGEGVPFHDIEPALGAFEPVCGGFAGSGGTGVSFFDAPVGVADQLGCADADDAEGCEGRDECCVTGGQSEAESLQDFG